MQPISMFLEVWEVSNEPKLKNWSHFGGNGINPESVVAPDNQKSSKATRTTPQFDLMPAWVAKRRKNLKKWPKNGPKLA